MELKEVSNQIADHTANGLAFTDNKGNETTHFQRAYLEGKLGGMNVSAGRQDFTIADGNGNSMPTGSDVVVSGPLLGCAPSGGVFTAKIANTLAPSLISLPLSNCTAGDAVSVEVTSPLKLVTRAAFIAP